MKIIDFEGYLFDLRNAKSESEINRLKAEWHAKSKAQMREFVESGDSEKNLMILMQEMGEGLDLIADLVNEKELVAA